VDFSSPRVLKLIESGIPCLTIDHMFKRIPAVLSDNETGIRKLLEYAIGRGHTKIAFIHGHNNSVVTRTRIEQFTNVMSYYKLPIPKEYIREGLYDDVPLTRKLVLELLKLEDRPTCILLPDDISYLGARDAVQEMGLRIPADISFLGYDGIPLIQSMSPQLTTIRQSTDLIGKPAAQRLISMIEPPSKYDRLPTIYPVELVEGGTVQNLK
jgi:DNA-binding LacI/PurR family transcriptional regulator